MKFKPLFFHLKWLFKKRYKIVSGCDPAIINRNNIVVMEYDRKYNRFKVIL